MRRTRLFTLVAAALALVAAAAVLGASSLHERQAEADVEPRQATPYPPAVRLERIAGTYPGALYVTAPPGDRWSAYEARSVYSAERAARLPRSTVVWPVAEYGRRQGVSVIGGYVYRGSAIPALRGWYLYGDWASARVWALRGPTGTPRPAPGLDRALSGITSFGQDAEGELYLTASDGGVYRIVR